MNQPDDEYINKTFKNAELEDSLESFAFKKPENNLQTEQSLDQPSNGTQYPFKNNIAAKLKQAPPPNEDQRSEIAQAYDEKPADTTLNSAKHRSPGGRSHQKKRLISESSQIQRTKRFQSDDSSS